MRPAATTPRPHLRHGKTIGTPRTAGRGAASGDAGLGPALGLVLVVGLVVGLVVALGLAGCAVEWRNPQPAQELARQAQPPGSVYLGWRVFQQQCAGCHGPAANGGNGGPDLLPRVREMGPRRFVGLVLRRYDWSLPQAQAASEGAAREALIDGVLLRRQGALTMPAWESDPAVSAHIADLHAYLAARAEGTQGPGRPAR